MRWAWVRVSRRLLTSIAVCVAMQACGGYASTTRIVDGEVLVGRPIEPESYALYLSAQLSEAQGGLHRARQLYLEATRLDPESPELWTRLGALSCRLKLALADRELERALRLDRWYAPAWVARAHCELFRGKLDKAHRFSKAAQIADPEDLETTLVLVEVLEAKGQPQRALNQLAAYTLRHPTSAAAAQKLSRRPTSEPTPTSGVRGPSDERLVSAVLSSDLDTARTRATTLRLPQSEVARLALELNRPILATRQMQLLLDAAPHDSELRALALLAAHRAQDAVLFERWLSLPSTFSTCSPTCISDVEQLLNERYH